VTGYRTHVEHCIGCGSCAILVPGVFAVDKRVRLLRQPSTPTEQRRCDVAALVCPTNAIARA
jgi:ferredoxin